MTDRVELRQAKATDVAAIRDLTRQAYARWVPLIGREPKPMTADYDAAVARNRFDLLDVDGVLAALIETVRKPDHLLVENVAVAPPFQGRGFGRRLMAHAEALARELGLDTIRLYTNQRFSENIALYRRLGYQVDREETLPVGNVVHMSKRLQGLEFTVKPPSVCPADGRR